MTLETQLRDLVAERADRFDAGQLLDVADVANSASARTKRSRAALAGAFVLVTMLGLGLITALVDSTPTNVVAGEGAGRAAGDGGMLVAQAVWVDDRFVGLATQAQSPPTGLLSVPYSVVESADGADWEIVAGSPIFDAVFPLLGEHDGIYFIVDSAGQEPAVSGEDGDAEPQALITTRSSTDLVTWVTRSHTLAPDTVPADHELRLAQMVAAEAGLLVSARVVPNYLTSFADEFEALGSDLESMCEMTGTSTQTTFRICGETETQRIDIDLEARREGRFEERVLFLPGGADPEVVSLPGIAPGRGPQTPIYATEDGFGIAAGTVYESSDGVEWTEIDTGNDTDLMVAARDGERVFRSWFPVARLGPDDLLLGMARRSGDAEWQHVDIERLYDDAPDWPRFFTDLRSGAAGWTLVAQRSFMQVPEVGVERGRSGASDFTVTSADGHVLSGHAPFGPATLLGPNGEVVREWEQLEVERPAFSGFAVDATGVSLYDDETGDTIVDFTIRQWATLIDPLNGIEYDLLFSADGQNWEIVATSFAMPQVVAMSDDRLIVRRHYLLGYANSIVEATTIDLN